MAVGSPFADCDTRKLFGHELHREGGAEHLPFVRTYAGHRQGRQGRQALMYEWVCFLSSAIPWPPLLPIARDRSPHLSLRGSSHILHSQQRPRPPRPCAPKPFPIVLCVNQGEIGEIGLNFDVLLFELHVKFGEFRAKSRRISNKFRGFAVNFKQIAVTYFEFRCLLEPISPRRQLAPHLPGLVYDWSVRNHGAFDVSSANSLRANAGLAVAGSDVTVRTLDNNSCTKTSVQTRDTRAFLD